MITPSPGGVADCAASVRPGGVLAEIKSRNILKWPWVPIEIMQTPVNRQGFLFSSVELSRKFAKSPGLVF
jgi:hypothetical protein